MNEVQKLDIYKRIAGIENKAESEDMKEELLDRFGEIPKSADNLLRIALVRVKAHRLYLTEVKGKMKRSVLFFIRMQEYRWRRSLCFWNVIKRN